MSEGSKGVCASTELAVSRRCKTVQTQEGRNERAEASHRKGRGEQQTRKDNKEKPAKAGDAANEATRSNNGRDQELS